MPENTCSIETGRVRDKGANFCKSLIIASGERKESHFTKSWFLVR